MAGRARASKPIRLPGWTKKLAAEINELVKRFDAKKRFLEKHKECLRENKKKLAKNLEREQKRRELLLRDGSAWGTHPGLEEDKPGYSFYSARVSVSDTEKIKRKYRSKFDSASGQESWEWLADQHPRAFDRVVDQGGLTVLGVWVPEELSTDNDLIVDRLFPIDHREYGLAEKYTLLAAIHDAAIKGQATILPQEVLLKEKPDRMDLHKDCEPFYLSEVGLLQPDVEDDVRLILRDVENDLIALEKRSKKASNRGRPVKGDTDKEEQMKKDWDRARENGISKVDFAYDHQRELDSLVPDVETPLKKLQTIIDRVRRREKRTKEKELNHR